MVKKKRPTQKSLSNRSANQLIADIHSLINSTRHQVAQNVNAGLVMLNWHIGKRIRLEIVATLSRQLGWSHFMELIPLKEQLKRDFYAEMCRMEHWSVRTLKAQMNSILDGFKNMINDQERNPLLG